LLFERWDASFDPERRPRTLRTWIVLGATLGAAMLARPQLALWGVLLAGAAVDDLRARRDTKLIARWLACAAAALLVFAPQLVVWKLLYGSWWVVPQGPGFMRWDAPCWSETLFSSRNGLFPWSPAYAVFAVALVAGARTHARVVGFAVAGVALQAIANGAAWDWWAGGSFGGRRFDSTFVAFAFGAAVVARWIVGSVAGAARAGAGGKARVRGACSALIGAWLVALVSVNLQMVARTTSTSARITGGVAAADVLRGRFLGGALAAWASSLANLPARALFAWRHDASLDAYDRVVGVHVLGDTYPGLNSYSDRTAATLPPPRFVDGKAHVLVELNRTGSIDVAIPIDGPAAITWNGRPVAPRFHTEDLVRGTNDLVIEAPPGTPAQAIELRASAIAPSRSQ
jgi:hypothetical protein